MQLNTDVRQLTTTPSAELMQFDVLSLPWNSLVKQFAMHADSYSYQILKTDFNDLAAPIARFNEGAPIFELVLAEAAKLEAELNATAKMAILLLLPAGGEIKPHVDKSAFFVAAHRCHLPLRTNEDCVFSFDDVPHTLAAGNWYEINNTQTHGFVNGGTTGRVHLVIDLLPNA
jgi:hypothetical protein